MQDSSLPFIQAAGQEIYDRKGFNILALDLKGISVMTDYCIIAEGNVDRHNKALAAAIIAKLRILGIKPAHVDGEETGDWIVIDYLDFVIHLFVPSQREKFSLEHLWRNSKIVDLKISVEKPATLSNNLV